MAKRIVRIIIFLLLLVLIAAAGFFAYITLSEYKPADREELTVEGAGPQIYRGQEMRIATWNIGYGALGDTADFFMDGGKSVRTADKEGVTANIDSIINDMRDMRADVFLLQEVDRDSARSCHVDELTMITDAFRNAYGQQDTIYTFANNYLTPFVPYPMPPIGKVDSGIMTLSRFGIDSAERISLPCPFNWPVRAVNLKRCLMIDRVPIAGGAQLVLINLHLEAYDDGEGKAAQTQMLKQIMDEEYNRGNYVIVGGDFNQTFSTVDESAYKQQEGMWEAGKIQEKEFSDNWTLLMDDSAPTCRSLDKAYAGADKDDFQFYMIDGFIVSNNIKVKKIKTKQLDFKNTDHNPVVMDIRLK